MFSLWGKTTFYMVFISTLLDDENTRSTGHGEFLRLKRDSSKALDQVITLPLHEASAKQDTT